MRCLRYLATLYREELPLAAQAAEQDTYMVDVLSGARTLQDVIEIQAELCELSSRGRFLRRKWRSNDPRALKNLQEHCKTDTLMTIEEEEALKTLGLLWNAEDDNLQYQIQLPEGSASTKRSALSKLSYPLGLIGPVLINGKILMQTLWSDKIE